MTEWWTYRPSDFLMFSPRIYWRLFESLNVAFWPAAAAASSARRWPGWAWVARRRRARAAPRARRALAALALCWWLVAWAFLWQRLRADQLAGGRHRAAVRAAGGRAVGAGNGRWRAGRRSTRRASAVGLVARAVGLARPPVAGVGGGRPWTQAEVFGLAADPTAIGTLGLLLLVRGPRWPLRALWFVPMAWCALSAATLWTMDSAQAG